MKNFVLRSLAFLSPIVLLYIITALLYKPELGDLTRVGYLRSDPDYREIFAKEYEKSFYFERLSQWIYNKKKCNVLTIGDSFSEGDNIGYQNYLGESSELAIVHFDRFFQLNKEGNPLQILYGLLNGDLLSIVEPDYIILEAIERSIVKWGNNIDTAQIILYSDFVRLAQLQNTKPVISNHRDKFLPDKILKFPVFNILYQFDDNAYFSKVYRVRTTQPLFSIEKEELLFTEDDLSCLDTNNDMNAINNLNQVLSDLAYKLNNKGIKLIVLPAPDKYDIFYKYIFRKSEYEEPFFFNLFEKTQKNYLYLESKKYLTATIQNNNKDIYFYDDTHWSPWASQIIAKELSNLIISDVPKSKLLMAFHSENVP
jgi:hypothetical protein